MKARRLLAVSLAALPLGLVFASPAMAGQSYPPETLSTGVVHCGQGDNITVTVDGVMPNSAVHIVIDFSGAPDVDVTPNADNLGFYTNTYPIPVGAGPVIQVTISGFDFPGNKPFQMPFNLDRRTCPDLPETGANSFPIVKVSIGVLLAGAFLAAVAFRRRPQEARVRVN
jgi:hypothetical protein